MFIQNHPAVFQIPNGLRLLLAATVVSSIGCGPQSDRLQVSGTITLDGAPLDNGSIRLTSTAKDKLFSSGATVKNGEFEIPAAKGLPPGTYRIEISAPDTAAPPVAQRSAPGERGAPPAAPERIPAEYNVDSTKTVEVTADGENHFPFDIVRQRAK